MTTSSGKRITQNQNIKRALASEGYNAEQLVAAIEREAVDAYIRQLGHDGRVVVHISTLEGGRRR